MALEKLTSTPGNAAEDKKPTKSVFAHKVAGVSSKPKPTFHRGSNQEGRWIKILGYGHSGTGKTLAIKGILEAGYKVLVVSTDLGGNGLSSVFNALHAEGKGQLCDNIVHADFPDYDSLSDFLKNPHAVFPEFSDFSPDWAVWDGFTGFQQVQIQSKILEEINPATKNSSDGREEGLWAEQQDWGMIRTATVRALNNFLNLHDWQNKKMLHKYMTCLEQKPTADKLSGEVMRSPYIQGSASALMQPAFDVIIEMRVKTLGGEEKGQRVYEYNCVGHDKLMAKARGYDLAPVEPGDMYNLLVNKIMPRLKVEKGEGK